MFKSLLLMMNFGVVEILLILLVVLLLFGSTQIPKLARSIGSSLKEFKKAQKEAQEEFKKNETEEKEKA